MNVGNGVAQVSSTIPNSRSPNTPLNDRIVPDHYSTIAVAGNNSLLNSISQHNNRANILSSTDKNFFP